MRKNIALLTAVLLVALGSSAFAKEKVYKWKLAMTWPSTFKPLTSPANKFADLVKKMSDGRLKVKVHGKNKHKAPLGILDMVKAGNYEMGHSASYYWKGKDINTPFFTSVPFGMTYMEFNSWFYYGGGLELMDRVYKKHGVYSFPGGNTGVQMGGWFKKEIKTVDDLKGLKIRLPGFAGEIYSKLGAVVTNVPPGELYTALERGTLDAVEWVAPYLDTRMGLNKVAKYYYSAWHEPASDTQFLINRKAYDKLPKDLQAIVKTAMQAVAADFCYESYTLNAQALEKMNAEYKDVKIKTLPAPVLKAMKKANDEIMADLEKRGGITKEIIDSQRNFQKQARKWTKISEYYYIDSMLKMEK